MGVATVKNSLNCAFNMALCVVLSYYEGNNIAPRQDFYWNKVGDVWFTIAVIPWIDNDNDFIMGRSCSSRWYYYRDKARAASKEIARHGEGSLGHLRIIGKNLTSNEVEDRLMSMVYWGSGFYVSDQTITLTRGPQSYAANYKTIDISDPFDKLSVYISKTRGNNSYFHSQIDNNDV